MTDGWKQKSSGQSSVVEHVYRGFLPSFIILSFMPGLPALRGGVTGRLLLNVGVFAFFSDGFKI
jgi:hypothetical protein